MSMGAGAFGSSAYLFLGGEYIFNIPRWASAIFFTGFAAGNRAVNLGMGENGAKAVGVITVALTYALIAVLAYAIWLAMKRSFYARRTK